MTTHKDDTYPVLGLAGETGEFVELVKKAWRDGGSGWAAYIDHDKVVSELGDIVWYVTRIAHVFDISLEEVLQRNIEKLVDRKENGKKE